MTPIKLKIQKLHNTTQLPIKASKGAACWDVYANRIVIEEVGKVSVFLGFAVEIPENYALVFVPRSNLTKTQWVVNNSPGQIDPDYRGECMFKFTGMQRLEEIELEEGRKELHINYGAFPYRVGDRVGQMYLREILPIELEVVEELSSTERGEGGFGSTGLT
jgi:dUTP pyrophosphatase